MQDQITMDTEIEALCSFMVLDFDCIDGQKACSMGLELKPDMMRGCGESGW
jgi:hypothetical protein